MKLSQLHWCCFRSCGRGRQFSSRTATLTMEAASSVETLGTIIAMTSYPWILAISINGWNAGCFTCQWNTAGCRTIARILQSIKPKYFFCFAILLRYNVLFLRVLAENLLAVWETTSVSRMPVLHVVTANIHNNQASTSHPILLLIISLCPHQVSCPYAQCVAVFKLRFTLPGSLRDPRILTLFNDIFICWSYITSAIDEYGSMVEWQWEGRNRTTRRKTNHNAKSRSRLGEAWSLDKFGGPL
jgi:hypothetical protein